MCIYTFQRYICRFIKVEIGPLKCWKKSDFIKFKHISRTTWTLVKIAWYLWSTDAPWQGRVRVSDERTRHRHACDTCEKCPNKKIIFCPVKTQLGHGLDMEPTRLCGAWRDNFSAISLTFFILFKSYFLKKGD